MTTFSISSIDEFNSLINAKCNKLNINDKIEFNIKYNNINRQDILNYCDRNFGYID